MQRTLARADRCYRRDERYRQRRLDRRCASNCAGVRSNSALTRRRRTRKRREMHLVGNADAPADAMQCSGDRESCSAGPAAEFLRNDSRERVIFLLNISLSPPLFLSFLLPSSRSRSLGLSRDRRCLDRRSTGDHDFTPRCRARWKRVARASIAPLLSFSRFLLLGEIASTTDEGKDGEITREDTSSVVRSG